MHQYGVRDVEKLLRLPRSTIRALIDAGFVAPSRGPRNALLFSFQDLVVLRTARALVEARVPRKRITISLRELRRHLPESMPLSGLSVCAVGERVVVREGARRWQADSGQYLLAFEGDPADGSLSVIERDETDAQASAEDWFEHAAALEADDPEAAIAAYERAIAADPGLSDARVNLGALLHERGRLAKAERVYRAAIASKAAHPLLYYNLGVLLEDLGRKREAVEAYETALSGNPGMADCHYNLALLCETLDRPKEAIRHMAQYRKLARTRST